MAELNNLRLNARGSGRRAVFYFSGTIDYDETHISRNGILLFLFFMETMEVLVKILSVKFYGQLEDDHLLREMVWKLRDFHRLR